MSVLKTALANPSRMQGIFKYLLHTKDQREKKEELERILSPDKLVEDKSSPRPMFREALNESLKCRLLTKEEDELYIAINPELPVDARNPKLGVQLLPSTLADLFFAQGNEDEKHFALDCAWYLAQDMYDPPGTSQEVEQRVDQQGVSGILRLTSDRLFDQLGDWMCYLGFAWNHVRKEGSTFKKILVPDPTIYIRRNLHSLFNAQTDEPILLKDFIFRLAIKCPLFETGEFRETIEANIGRRQPNYLSTSTAFALFRLVNEGCIKLERQSDADFLILPKANNQVDDDGRTSHIIYCNKEV